MSLSRRRINTSPIKAVFFRHRFCPVMALITPLSNSPLKEYYLKKIANVPADTLGLVQAGGRDSFT